MHRLRLRAALPLCVAGWFIQTVSGQPVPATWKLLHTDAKALIGIDVRSLRESKTGQSVGTQVQSSGLGMFRIPGLELFKYIDQAIISSPGAKSANPKENPPFLAVLTGRFDLAQLRKLFSGKHRTYSSITIYGSPDAGNLSLAMIDENTLLLGDEPSLRGAIDRRSASLPGGTLVTRAISMAAQYDFWLIATVSPAAFKPATMNLSKMLLDIQGVDAGFSMRDGFRGELDVVTKTPQAAQEIAEQILTQMHQALALGPDAQQNADLARKLEVSSAETRLAMKIVLSKEEVDQMIKTMRARQPVQATRAVPLRDDGPKTIRIYGLDDGVKEIPLGPKK